MVEEIEVELSPDSSTESVEKFKEEWVVVSEAPKVKRDALANKYMLNDAQVKYVQEYLSNGGNSTKAMRKVNPDAKLPWQQGYSMRNNPKVIKYLEETANKCLKIQMGMIENEKTPASVRNDAIKDRLNRAGVGDKPWIWGWEGNWYVGSINISIDR